MGPICVVVENDGAGLGVGPGAALRMGKAYGVEVDAVGAFDVDEVVFHIGHLGQNIG